MPVKAVLFDFGGTLVSMDPSFRYENCLVQLHRTLTKSGITVPYEGFEKVHFEILDKHYRKKSLKEATFSSLISRTLKRFGYSLSPTDKRIGEAVEAHMQPFIEARRIDKDLYSVLQELKRRYRLGIVSNFGHTPALLQTLDELRLTDFFDAVIVSANVGWRKPSRKIFEAALKALGVSALETVFVGDSLRSDVLGAQRAGMRTVLLLKKTSQEENPVRVSPDRAVKSLKELPELLPSL